MQSRNFNNFQAGIRSQAARRRTQYTRRQDDTIQPDVKQDTRHECRDSKDKRKSISIEETQRPNSARDFYSLAKKMVTLKR